MEHDCFLKKRAVCVETTLSSAQLDREEAQGRFPKRIQLSPRRVVWSRREVLEWIEERKAGR